MAKDLKQFIYNADDLADMLDQEERRKRLEENKSKPKLNLEDFIITKAKDRNQYDVIDPDTNKAIGHFPYYQSRIRNKDLIGLNQIQLPDYITTDYPFIEPEYQGRGLGKQMYKFLERETGKTILPDTSLSESSLPLHKSSGLGKDFGSSNYKDKIIQSIKKQLGPESTQLAEQLYEGLKNKIQKQGLTGFKSLVPFLGKVGTAAAGGLYGLAAEASDANEMQENLEQEALLREVDEQKRRSSALKNSSDEQRQALSKMYQNIDNPSEQEKSISRMKLLDSMLKKR